MSSCASEGATTCREVPAPPETNDAGARVRAPDGGLFYCGRRVGVDALEDLSDGVCGPNDGPQCDSCQRYQARHAWLMAKADRARAPVLKVQARLLEQGGTDAGKLLAAENASTDEDDDEDDDDADDDVVRAFSVAARPTTPSPAPPVREPPTSQASRWFAATTTSTPRRAPSTRGASPPAFGERRPAASWWRGPRDDASRRSQRRPRAVRVDVESVAPTGLCGAIMQPLFADDADDERPTRRARSVSSLDDAADERGTISSSESETTSPRRRRRVDAAPRELGVSALASLPARLTPGEQRRLRQQLVVQDQIQFSDSPLFSRRPSLPTPRRDDSPPPPWNLDSPLDSAASSDDGQPSRRRAPRSARRPRRLAALTAAPASPAVPGKYTPHLVVVSLVETTRNLVTGELEGKLLQATALDDHSFSGAGGESAGSDIVTSVKLSPTASLVLLGHSRGGDGTAGDGIPRVVSVIYRVGDMARINTRKEVGDDVNIARFHPVSGAGIVYGTKQGRICKITPARSHHHPA